MRRSGGCQGLSRSRPARRARIDLKTIRRPPSRTRPFQPSATARQDTDGTEANSRSSSFVFRGDTLRHLSGIPWNAQNHVSCLDAENRRLRRWLAAGI